jgi:death on curing protein
MTYLTKAEIVAINHNQIELFGGNFVPPRNFLHEENLDYLVEAVEVEMFGAPLYPDIHQKAGLYMFSIVCNHIFQDGNKRTGLQAATIFLLLNNYGFASFVTDDVLTNFTLSVASGEQTLEQVQAWFGEHITLLLA